MIRKKASAHHAKRKLNRRSLVILASLILLALAAVGATIAYLVDSTQSITNTFLPSQVSCSVVENFDNNVKSNVTVLNDSNIDAYVRVRLVSYRVNDNDERIGGTAEIPNFTPGAGWKKNGDMYYYTTPVKAGATPANALIGTDGITLAEYTDADGGKQVIEVIAEAIQALPKEAVENAWKVTVTDGTIN